MHQLQKCSVWRERGKRHAENAGRTAPSSGPSLPVQVRQDNLRRFVSSRVHLAGQMGTFQKAGGSLGGVVPVLAVLLPSETLKGLRWHFCWPAQAQTAPPTLNGAALRQQR